MSFIRLIQLLMVLAVWLPSLAPADPAAAHQAGLTALGELLFFEPSLSNTRSQSCSTCHDPAFAFSDPCDNGSRGSVSRGDD